MNLRTDTVLPLIIVLGLLFTPVTHGMVTNGSLTGPTGNGILPAGWTPTTGSPDTNDVNQPAAGVSPVVSPSGPSPDGGTWVGVGRFDSFPFIEGFGQNLTGLSVGTTYELSWYAANFGALFPTVFGVEPAAWIVEIDGVSIGQGAVLDVGDQWFAQSLTFMATSTSGFLSFGTTPGENYLSIDGIALSVSEIPIPAAVWLFGTALIGLVGFARRRKAV